MNGKEKAAISTAVAVVAALAIISATLLIPLSPSSLPATSPIGKESGTTAGNQSPSGPSGTATSTVLSPGAGILVLRVKDAPPEERVLAELDVRIENVSLHRADENESQVGFPVVNSSEWYDLTALTGDLSAIVGNASMPSGKYVMIVFNITEARAKFNNTATGTVDSTYTPLRVVANGKLMVPVHFEIVNGTTTEVTLDFDLDQMKVNPNDVLRPVIKPSVKGPYSGSENASENSSGQTSAAEAPRERPESPGEQGQGQGSGEPQGGPNQDNEGGADEGTAPIDEPGES